MNRQEFPMREWNAIRSVLTKALMQARQADARRIASLRLAVGDISELDESALRQHWAELSQGTPAEGAHLHLRFIEAEVQCMACFEKYHPVHGKIHCPYCGSYGAKVLSGEEFYLDSIEWEDE